jgi:hypothetical protein
LSGEENKEHASKEEEYDRPEEKAVPKEEIKLQLRDWLALIIAAIETTLLPYILLLAAILILAIILPILF